MNSTVIVAFLGLASTLAASSLAAYWQRLSNRENRLFDARVRCYTECLAALYEYERATYNRVKARLGRPEDDREEERQLAWRMNGTASAAVAALTLMTADSDLRQRADQARKSIGHMNSAENAEDLLQRRHSVDEELQRLADNARLELMKYR